MCCPHQADRIIALKVNGRVIDLNSDLSGDIEADVIVSDDEDKQALNILRHSSSHLLAEAVREIYGEKVQYTIGPALTEDFKYGFYYDFDLPEPISADNLGKIEKRMRKLAGRRSEFKRSEVSLDQARETFRSLGQHYKLELIDDLAREEGIETVTLYRHGGFLDLCRGPHLPDTGLIRAFKLQAVAGAYWRGDASNTMLTRIYGVAFFDDGNLDRHIEKVATAERRDHRRLGKELDLYSINDQIGPGLVLWHGKGAIVRRTIEQFWVNEHLKRGYELTYTPHIASERVYQRSGHLEKYADMMYSPMDIDGVKYYLRPMNCPGHYIIYQSQTRSYRDLPIRMCELGTVYRYEPSGTLHGMFRVRGFTQDDAHTFCTPDQLGGELDLILELMDLMMRSFGYQYKAYLATRPEQYLGTVDQWDRATGELRAALDRRGLDYEIDEGGGVFYAPKIDIKLIDSMGRQWQGPTHQVDLQAATRFGISYVGADNSPHEPVIIHRTVLGSMERFVGGLIEHYGGAFPLWLAPVQVAVLPVSEKFNAYGRNVYQALLDRGLRVRLDVCDEKVGAKIRRATLQKVPYMLIVGAREQGSGQVSVRAREQGDLGPSALGAFIETVFKQIETRAL